MTADPLRYKKTTVLLLHWHHTVDDLKVKPEVYMQPWLNGSLRIKPNTVGAGRSAGACFHGRVSFHGA